VSQPPSVTSRPPVGLSVASRGTTSTCPLTAGNSSAPSTSAARVLPSGERVLSSSTSLLGTRSSLPTPRTRRSGAPASHPTA
jgi:hypothetical protein